MNTPRLTAIAIAAAAALLAGCMNLAPRYERPAAPVAERFPLAPEGAASAPAAAELDWQAFFGDERLKRLIALALANNRDLRIAALNIEATRAQAAVRDADRWPTLNAGLTGSRTSLPGGINSTYTAGLQVTAYELDLFGRLRNLSDAAAAQVLASEEARKAVQISLVAAVANAHVALAADDALLALTRQTLATREESLRLVKLRFDNGASSELDWRQAESLLEAARAGLAMATRQRALDENALTLLLGQPLPADLPPALPVEASAGLAELPVGLASEVLLRRPDVRQAEQQLIAANANIGAARAAFFPRITLTGSAGLASGHLSDLFKSGHSAWSFAPALIQPLFDAGRNQGNLELAKANRDIAVAQYERAIQSSFREVADALAGRATLGEQLAAQRRQMEAEQARSRLVELRWRNGAASSLELLDAQRSLFSAQQALLQLQAQQTQNLATLYKVLGGGWK
ncbi:efflux transporter outer membrane subunit [Piscinibacter sp.]|uniref:efflux transporter outer membrane subunit n=1 Tax=Piscinibacter sp. TaxID=1903157 RepID=UPI0039E524CB